MYIPKTEKELENWMKENCYNFFSYSINGNFIYEGYGIDNFGGLYSWYFTERGQQDKLKYFQSEAEAVEYAFKQITSDDLARRYCIGFTTSTDEKKEQENVLLELGLEFSQDTIPYYGNERLVYRTFVFGCDIKKTEYLKEKYYKGKK